MICRVSVMVSLNAGGAVVKSSEELFLHPNNKQIYNPKMILKLVML